MQYRTSEQNKMLFRLFSQMGIDDSTRAALALQYSNNRTAHTSELYINECAKLITDLSGSKPAMSEADREKVVLAKAQWCLVFALRDKGFNLPNGKPDLTKINNYTTHYWGKRVFDMGMKECNKYIAVVKEWREKDAAH